MPSVRISKENASGWYFVTFTTQRWYYLFDRHKRWNILADSLNYCIENKSLQVYGYVFMLNHIHLLFSSPDSIGFVRDFKAFTTKALKKNILETEPHTLSLFVDEGGLYSFWQKTNMPLYIETEEFFRQKLEYIHNNPVKKGYVEKPEYWYWSSANPNSEIKISQFT